MPSDKDSVETAQLEPGADTAPSMANPLEGAVTRDFYVLPIPRYLQHSKARPQQFTLGVNVLFFLISFASYGNVNLCVPILLSLSRHLDVSYAASSKLASFATGGLTLGIFLICPLGDTSRRRPIFLLFTVLGCLASMGLAITNDFNSFAALTFLAGFCSIPYQMAIPWTGDLAPDGRRASAIGITMSGFLSCVPACRILAGLTDKYATYKIAYGCWAGLQAVSALSIYFLLPDFPAKDDTPRSYRRTMLSLLYMLVSEPLCMQLSICAMLVMVIYGGLWTSNTYLVGLEFGLSSLSTGLMSLIVFSGALAAVALGIVGDRVPLTGIALIALGGFVVGSGLYIGLATSSLAIPIVVAILVEVSNQAFHGACETILQSVDPRVGARFNTIYGTMAWLGATAANEVLLEHGYRAVGGLFFGVLALAFLVFLCRGPYEERYVWFGWHAGWHSKKQQHEIKSWVGDAQPEELA